MLVYSRAALIGIVLATALVSVLFLSSTTWRFGHGLALVSPPTTLGLRSSLERDLMVTLNVASRIYVINLPKDTCRRADMEQLRYTLGLDFTYVNGTEADGDMVQRIMRQVAALRILEGSHEINRSLPTALGWPQDVDALTEFESPLDQQGSDLWLSDDIKLPEFPSHEPLTCASDYSTLEPYSPQTPPYRLLTKERLACWHSHWRVIRLIADGQDDVSLILEDDVDMELDIRQRLLGVWRSLPNAWDIIFLGHCWSEESRIPAIAAYSSSIPGMTVSVTTLHPSTSPKCTHAYALSRKGARRLAVYLRHPPFAYSRAIDQAISWLVESGKLRSFSIVPSIVIQRKADDSNISSGRGSSWRDNLTRGVFT